MKTWTPTVNRESFLLSLSLRGNRREQEVGVHVMWSFLSVSLLLGRWKQSVRKPSVLCICNIAQDEHSGNFVLDNYYRENRMAFLLILHLTIALTPPISDKGANSVPQVNKTRKVLKYGFIFFEKRSCDFMLEGQNKAIYKNVSRHSFPRMSCYAVCYTMFLGLFVWTNGSGDAKNSSPFWEKTRYLNSLTLEGINCQREKCELERFVNVADSNAGISC